MLIILLISQIALWIIIIVAFAVEKGAIDEEKHRISLLEDQVKYNYYLDDGRSIRSYVLDHKEELIKSQKMLNAIIEHLGCDIEKVEAMPDRYKLIKRD